MKKQILILLTVITSLSYNFAFAGTPPTSVLNSFKLKFPNATNVKWGKENAQEWEADFNFNGGKLSANFTSDGKWIETEKEIKSSDFPTEVNNAIQTKYPGWKITEADQTETLKFGLIYEADIQLGKLKKEVSFMPDGSEVKE